MRERLRLKLRLRLRLWLALRLGSLWESVVRWGCGAAADACAARGLAA